MQKLSDEAIEFFKNCRALVDHAAYMKLATNYKKEFNYSFYCSQLHKVLKELGSEEDIRKIYPQGLR